MNNLQKKLLLVCGLAITALLAVQFVRLLEPAHAREVQAACNGMRPAPENPAFRCPTAANPNQLCTFPTASKDFSLQDAAGDPVSLSDYRGKVVLVNFWASWCNVCKSEKPSLESLQAEFAGDDFTVLALASDRQWPEVWQSLFGLQVKIASELPPQVRGKLPDTGADAVVVETVDRNRAADLAGLRAMDIITAANGNPIASIADLERAVQAGQGLELTVSRGTGNETTRLGRATGLRVLLDPPAGDSNLGVVTQSWGPKAVPESFLVDKNGIIRHYFINKRDWNSDVARTCVRALLAE